MAKELAMVERTPMGKWWRQYFIRCEKLYWEAAAGGALPHAAAASPVADLPPAIREHLEAIEALKRTGMTANQASQVILRLSPARAKPVAEPAEPDPLAPDLRAMQREAYITLLVSVAPADGWFGLEQIFNALPMKHPLLRGKIHSRSSRVGKLLSEDARRNLLAKDPEARIARYFLLPTPAQTPA